MSGRAGRYALRGALALWVGGLVLLPLAATVAASLRGGFTAAVTAVTAPAALEALWLSAWTGLIAAVVNALAGTAIAWMIVRWKVPGRAWLSALVDLPLAIPTLVAGIVLVALYGPQTLVGATFAAWGAPIAFARPGIVLALLFVTLPFVVRVVEPVLAELDPAEEEAAATLGASQITIFFRVLLPPLLPAIAAGAIQTFARATAEFGSIAAVSGNMPGRTLVAPVYVLGEVEGGDVSGAAAVSVVLLALSLVLHPLARQVERWGGVHHA